MNHKKYLISAVLVAALSNAVYAAVTTEEAKQLGGATLTTFGAERAGNKDGSIPEWSDQRIKAPTDFDSKDPLRMPSPWKDKPQFSITAQNLDKYADRLTEGQKGLFKIYPNYRMDIYPSRRSAAFPKYVLDNTLKNATSCKAIDNQLILQGCYGGFPFPIPKTGNEVLWNHVTRYTFYGWTVKSTTWVVDATGKASLQGAIDAYQMSPFYDPAKTSPAPSNELYWRLRYDTNEPARKAGEKVVLLDPLDFINVGRRAYQYIPGQRRVKLAPDLAYDTPSPVSGGSATMDQQQIFLGGQDRYDFKLIGKQEKYIMYNNYEIVDHKACPADKALTKNYFNPDCARWELHRVWVVQATIKPGYRHLMPKRTLYFDEDTFAAGTSDDYDASGKLYRMTTAPYVHVYSSVSGFGNYADSTIVNDFQTGIWSMTAFMSRPGDGIAEVTPKPVAFYTPEAMAGEGIR